MGIIMSQLNRPESLNIGGPIMRTPLGALNAGTGGYNGTECEAFQLRLMDCAQAYGMIRSKEKCKDLFQDFQECCHKWKQLERMQLMGEERKKQYFNSFFGLGPPVEKLYGPKVRQDAYAPDPWEDQWFGH